MSDDGESVLGDDDDDDDYVVRSQLLEERISVASQLADAIAYLHTRNVIHRDLKPDNVGFDKGGVLKVFDFDIARVAPTNTQDVTNLNNKKALEDETFLMTGKVGSPRYMSPEVARREPYNLKADVYSYAVMTHEILTLEKPYDDISDENHDNFVFYKGVRPRIPSGLPPQMKKLLKKSWSHTIAHRPTMKVVRQVLAEERSEILRLGTIGMNEYSKPVKGYVASCSFLSASDHIKKTKTKKSKNHNKHGKNSSVGIVQNNCNNENINHSNPVKANKGLLSMFRRSKNHNNDMTVNDINRVRINLERCAIINQEP